MAMMMIIMISWQWLWWQWLKIIDYDFTEIPGDPHQSVRQQLVPHTLQYSAAASTCMQVVMNYVDDDDDDEDDDVDDEDDGDNHGDANDGDGGDVGNTLKIGATFWGAPFSRVQNTKGSKEDIS